MVYGVLRALPGERCTIAPVALRMADAAARSGNAHHRNTWRTDPGRQDHTILPYASRTRRWHEASAHGCPPCEAVRAAVTRVHRRPTRVRDDRDTPLFLGPGCAHYPPIPNFGKEEYFTRRGLTEGWGVLPVGQREGLIRRGERSLPTMTTCDRRKLVGTARKERASLPILRRRSAALSPRWRPPSG